MFPIANVRPPAKPGVASPIGQDAYADVRNFAECVAVTYITEIQKF